jgi:hypothetical protein
VGHIMEGCSKWFMSKLCTAWDYCERHDNAQFHLLLKDQLHWLQEDLLQGTIERFMRDQRGI